MATPGVTTARGFGIMMGRAAECPRRHVRWTYWRVVKGITATAVNLTAASSVVLQESLSSFGHRLTSTEALGGLEQS
jgi:hypothetical protein